jgi:hypothetical protein
VISSTCPLFLDYSPNKIVQTVSNVKAALSSSLDEVGHSWWVPQTYEVLAKILQEVAKQKNACHELPIVTVGDLLMEINLHREKTQDDSLLLSKMNSDSKLRQRAINYLEAVGDLMQTGQYLLLDPIGWFSGFLAHFIKDDLACTTIQVDAATLRGQRGTISLDEIVKALGHEYKSPQENVSQIMSLLCSLELCTPLDNAYLFPCLLPPLSSTSELLAFDTPHSIAIRGHRFREVSGFIPPGLFVSLLARMYRKMQRGVMHPL